MNEIARLELLSNPSDEWLKMIKDSNDKAQDLYNGEGSDGDFLEAFWYHSIIADSAQYNAFQPVIRFNNNR